MPLPQAQWLAGGKAYTALEKPKGAAAQVGDSGGGAAHDSGGGGASITREIVRYDALSGERTVLVSLAQLTPPGSKQPLDIDEYTWSDDGKRLLIFTNSQQVWRMPTRGNYYVLDVEGRRPLQRIGADLDNETLMYAKFSPGKGDRVGFVYKNNILVQDLNSGAVTDLTYDGLPNQGTVGGGTGDIINGNFDWAYEEEFSLSDGWRWSPDGRKVAFWQLHTQDVKWYALYDTQSEKPYAKVTKYPYPKVGTKNSYARIGVVDANGSGNPKWMSLDLPNNREHYVARMEWAASSSELLVQRLPRDQNRIDVMLCDVNSGSARLVLSETDSAWIDVDDSTKWLSGGKAFTWLSERSGYKHMYLVSRDGSQMKDITRQLGEADVISVLSVDEKCGEVYFIASPQDPTDAYLYRAALSGDRVERITPMGDLFAGRHGYSVSPDGANFAVHRWSSFGTPMKVEMVTLPNHAVAQPLMANAELEARLGALEGGDEEFFGIDIDGEDLEGVPGKLDGWVMYPPGFKRDEATAEKYPLLVYVYGEPCATTVNNAWDGYRYLWHRMMAQKGYVVVSFDNRGTPAPKGRAWRKVLHKKIGVTGNDDQAAAVKALLARWTFLDPKRVGIWGWSGGGSSTLQAMFRFPDVYTAGCAIAFISDQKFYDTIYQERYMGVPPGCDGRPADGDGWGPYKEGSAITYASGLKGPLLLVYGTGDDNCHYQHFEALVNKLIAEDKYFEMLSYPNRTHAIEDARGKNTRKHLFESITRFFLRTVPPVPGKPLLPEQFA